eukprot:2121835-Amphidinium_carterae.2
MVMSAMVNLLADAGIVPSWSSASALAQSCISNLQPRPLRPYRSKTNKFHPSTDLLRPNIGAILESRTLLVLNAKTACQQGFHPH